MIVATLINIGLDLLLPTPDRRFDQHRAGAAGGANSTGRNRTYSTIVSEPDVRDKIVKGVCTGVDNFIESLGSMADMARGFLNMDSVEEKIREYLIDKNDDIVTWLQSEKVQAKVVTGLKERSLEFGRHSV